MPHHLALQDVEALRTITNRQIPEEPVATSGHNWGRLAVDGSTLVFKVGGRAAFSVPLPDVSQAQQGREEVMLEFPLDDTVAGARGGPASHCCEKMPAHAAASCAAPLQLEGQGRPWGR